MGDSIWYSYKGKRYNGKCPPYCDLTGIAWYDKLRQDMPQIRSAVFEFLKTDGLEIAEYFNSDMVEGAKWEAISFLFWNERNVAAMKSGAGLYAYFSDIPGMVSLAISILQPNTRIKGHYGDTDATYRIHIPIYIPSQDTEVCGMKVGGISRAWNESELIVFTDACYHEAWNMTDKRRVVMIMDIVREELQGRTDEICSRVLASMKYQRLLLRYKIVKKIPGWLRNTIIKAMALYS